MSFEREARGGRWAHGRHVCTELTSRIIAGVRNLFVWLILFIYVVEIVFDMRRKGIEIVEYDY